MNATDHVDHYKKPRAWHWRPVRVAGQNAIGVFRGRRLVQRAATKTHEASR